MKNHGIFLSFNDNPKHVKHSLRPDDFEYGRCIQTLPVSTVDCIFINKNNKTFILAKRTQHPMKDEPWFFGGRIKFGVPVKEMLDKIILHETGIKMYHKRIYFLTFIDWLFSIRSQEPQDIGSHNILHLFVYRCTQKEIKKIINSKPNDGFDHKFGFQEFDRKRIQEECRPEILKLYDMIFD